MAQERKYALVTGVSSGIGEALIKPLIQNGFIVIGTVRKNIDKERLLGEYGAGIRIITVDVTEVREDFKKELEKVSEGRLDLLVNNAGLAVPGPMLYLSDEEFDYQMQVNVMGARKVTNAALHLLGMDTKREKPATIVFISSISGRMNLPFNGAYCISKHALESMVDIYRRELYPYGIKVVSILPGPIKTKIWGKNIGALTKYEDSPYKSIIKKADKLISDSAEKALPTTAVTDLILKILRTKSPKTRYIVHKNKTIFKIISSFVPDKILDKMIWKNFNKGKSLSPGR